MSLQLCLSVCTCAVLTAEVTKLYVVTTAAPFAMDLCMCLEYVIDVKKLLSLSTMKCKTSTFIHIQCCIFFLKITTPHKPTADVNINQYTCMDHVNKARSCWAALNKPTDVYCDVTTPASYCNIGHTFMYMTHEYKLL